VGKPFHYPELLARLTAALRRRVGRRRGPIRVGELTIDPVTRRVRVGDRRVELANKEFVLLRTLASEPRRVFTKDELLRDVWGFKSMGAYANARLAREPASEKAGSVRPPLRLQRMGSAPTSFVWAGSGAWTGQSAALRALMASAPRMLALLASGRELAHKAKVRVDGAPAELVAVEEFLGWVCTLADREGFHSRRRADDDEVEASGDLAWELV